MEYPIENQPTPLARQEEIVVQELSDEVLVYDLRQHKAHCLNKSAAFIWEQCDGVTSVSELAQRANAEFEAPIDENMIWQTLDRLSKADLLTAPIKRPAGERFRSRRAMIGKLSAAAMLSIPVVMSITSPVGAAAASVPPACTDCTNFGSGKQRANTCPSECGPTIIGTCYNNNSCPGIGGQFPDASCNACFTNNPTSSSWRVNV